MDEESKIYIGSFNATLLYGALNSVKSTIQIDVHDIRLPVLRLSLFSLKWKIT